MTIAAPARLIIPSGFRKFQPLLLVYFAGLFVALIFPVRAIEYEAADVAARRLVNYQALYESQTTAEGRAYAWTRPEARLYFNDVPRYAPLRVELDLNFDRPADMPPAQLQLTEIRSREPSPQLLTLVADPQRPGFHTYTLTVPPCATCETGLTLELKANGFRPPGETRTLGVVMGHFSVQLGSGHYRYLLWPQPYFLAVLLIGLGLLAWLWRTGSNWSEGLLWLTPPVLCLAIFCPVLYDDTWWLMGLALAILVTALSYPHLRLSPIIPMLVACAALIIIFAIVPLYVTDIKDLQLYQNWLNDIERHGPFNIYNYSATLDYLPLLLYVLWFFNLITRPFGLSGDALTLKLFFSLPILLNLWLLWRTSGIKSLGLELGKTSNSPTPDTRSLIPDTRHPSPDTRHPSPNTRAALLLVGLSTTLIFNATVWGQTDTLLACMLVWTLLAIQNGRPGLAGGLLGLDVALKPQSWIVAPLLALFLLRGYGWRKTLTAGGISLLLVFGLSAAAFGFDFESFRRFFFQPAFAGDLNLGSINAYNLLYLLGYSSKEAPQLIAWGGFALIGLVYLLSVWLTWRRDSTRTAFDSRTRQALAAALVLIVFFLCAIKMRERYLEYGLLFVGLAALSTASNRLLLIFLVLDLLSMLNVLAVYVVHRNEQDVNTVFFWREIVLSDWLPFLIAAGIIASFGYLLQQFLDKNKIILKKEE